jgi:spermidine synthase
MPGHSPGGRRAAARAVHQDVGGGLAELVPDLSRPGSWLLFLDGVPQSQVDLDDPATLEFEYVRRIGHVVDLAFPPRERVRALHLGGGGLTLPRYVAHTRPGSGQVVAESDTALTELVRRHLPLPAGNGRSAAGRIRVRAQDARAVLESARPGSYDLVISDVFAGARTPFHMTTAQCAAAARRALGASGVYVANVADGPPLAHARAQVATVGTAFANVSMIAEPGVLRGRRTGNLVLVASDGPLPEGELTRRVAADPFPARLVTGPELARFASGAAPVADGSEPAQTARAAWLAPAGGATPRTPRGMPDGPASVSGLPLGGGRGSGHAPGSEGDSECAVAD